MTAGFLSSLLNMLSSLTTAVRSWILVLNILRSLIILANSDTPEDYIDLVSECSLSVKMGPWSRCGTVDSISLVIRPVLSSAYLRVR